MSQKAKQKNETNHVTDTLVETLWDQYEGALARYRTQTDERYDAYLNALKQTRKFNQDYRETLKGFYQEARNTNKEVYNGITSNITERLQREPSEKSKEVQNQWRDVTSRLEEISVTPMKQMFEMINRVEDRIEQNTEQYINYRRNRRKAWASLTDEYIQYARTQNINAARRLENSFRTLVNTGN
ncbi:MAG: hypothetical protein LPK26_06860 [Bacillaceae bacterium]|nr:hypothetical protein [Bacillaceae bacterium]